MAEFPIPSFLENMSAEEIHAMMKAQMPGDIDMSEGGHPWNLTYPTAYIASYFAEFVVPEAIKIIFPKYAQDYADTMIDHAEMRGMERKAATFATGEITVKGDPGTEIPVGTQFSTASINGEPAVEFETTEAATIGENGSVIVNVQAIEAGTAGNVAANTIILKANKIDGISGVTNSESITGGTEAESIENLQERIMDYDNSKGVSFVGSESDYRRWSLEVDGVGSAVIIGAQDDSGLVTIVLTDANGKPANEALREAVYNHIMRPDAPSERLAPINGGNIAVVAPETIALTISVVIEADGTKSEESIKSDILEGVKTYLVEATQDAKVRYTKIGSIVSETAGVEDYNSLLVNGSVANIPINDYQLPAIEEKNLKITFGSNLSPDSGSSGGSSGDVDADVTQEEIEEAIGDYLAENSIEEFLETDDTLIITDAGELGVNTTEDITADNGLPATANAVYETVGVIDDTLEDI